MKVNYKGEIVTLPEWYKLKSSEEISKAAEIVYQANHNPIKRQYADPTPVKINYNHLISELRKEGYSSKKINQIVAMVECGHTLDSAIQSI